MSSKVWDYAFWVFFFFKVIERTQVSKFFVLHCLPQVFCKFIVHFQAFFIKCPSLNPNIIFLNLCMCLFASKLDSWASFKFNFVSIMCSHVLLIIVEVGISSSSKSYRLQQVYLGFWACLKLFLLDLKPWVSAYDVEFSFLSSIFNKLVISSWVQFSSVLIVGLHAIASSLGLILGFFKPCTFQNFETPCFCAFNLSFV